MNRAMMKNPGYDMDKDLTLISVIPGAGLLLVSSPQMRREIARRIGRLCAKNKVNFGTYSAGSAPHMTINELNKQYGIAMEAIHYRGEAPMWQDLVGGTLDVAMGSFTAAQPALHDKRDKAFWRCIRGRSSAIPHVKTLPDQGATSKFFSVSGFTGWAVPKATPQPIVDRFAELIVAANKDPKVKEILSTFVLDEAIDHGATRALYRYELPIWMESAAALGLQPA